MKIIITRSIVLALMFLLYGCGGGTDSSKGVVQNEVVIQGSVGDGPIVGATVSIYDKNGKLLATQESNAQATYSIKVNADQNQFPLTVKATGGTDLVTNAAPDFVMYSTSVSPTSNHANINPYSTVIYKIAKKMGGLNEGNVAAAKDIVLSKLNFGIDTKVVPDPITTPVISSNVAHMVKTSETMAEMLRRTHNDVVGTGSTMNMETLVDAVATDLVDGKLDGAGGSGSDPRIAAFARVNSAFVLTESMNNQLKVNGVVSTQGMDNSIVATHSDATSLTSSVPISPSLLSQAIELVNSARKLSSNPALLDLQAKLLTISPDSLPGEVQPLSTTGLEDVKAIITTAETKVLSNFNSDSGVANSAPVISGTPVVSISEGAAYQFIPAASDNDGDTLTFSIKNKPVWASFNTSNGVMSGTPGYAHAGTYSNIVISVSDGTATANLPAFTITVSNTNRAPTIGGTPAAAVTAGTLYTFVPSASDPDKDVLAYSIQGKPSWASFNAATGTLSGTPAKTDAGVYSNISISVSDGSAVATLGKFSITVGVSSNPPSISGIPPTTAKEGQVYLFTPSANDVDGDTLTFGIVNKPSWASFNQNTGQLSGSPGYDNAGVYSNIRISVSDATSSVSLPDFTITVSNTNRAPVISGTAVSSVDSGSPYSFTPASSDPDGDVLSFSIQNKPSWASFNTKTGALNGTPATSDVATYSNIIISVSDGSKTVSLAGFSIIVNGANHAPVISGSGAATITVGTPYSFTPNSSDADGDTLTFSIQNKPSWASFDVKSGMLSGTPAAGDVATFGNITITVTDGTKSVSLAAFSIIVNDANHAPVISGSGAATITAGTPYGFIPTSSDADGDTLTFSIQNKPVWASFDSKTGALSGTPATGDIATYSNIIITVSDGKKTTSLAGFTIQVTASVATRSVTLSWAAPSTYDDNSSLALSDIGGYRIYHGTSASNLVLVADVNDNSAISYTVTSLPIQQTHYFAITTYDKYGVESNMSAVFNVSL